jgi:hypothetical protein
LISTLKDGIDIKSPGLEEKEDEAFEKPESFGLSPKQTSKNDPNKLMKAYRGEIEISRGKCKI